MPNLSLNLTAFQGPLDLLMHLIDKDKIDIYDIPIVSITEQYISYLRNLQEFDIEVASEFLVMAATLLQIKSRMLLPKPVVDEEEEGVDPRTQLVEMLIEYRRIKRVAQALGAMKQSADKFVARTPMFANLVERRIVPQTVADLLKALADVVQPVQNETAYIEPQAFSVQEKMSLILERLRREPEGFLLSDVLVSVHSGEKVASFLGVLELLKMGMITVSQREQFAPIYIFGK